MPVAEYRNFLLNEGIWAKLEGRPGNDARTIVLWLEATNSDLLPAPIDVKEAVTVTRFDRMRAAGDLTADERTAIDALGDNRISRVEVLGLTFKKIVPGRVEQARAMV